MDRAVVKCLRCNVPRKTLSQLEMEINEETHKGKEWWDKQNNFPQRYLNLNLRIYDYVT